MKYGIIGCGRISPNHIASAKDLGLDIVALCDINLEKCKKLIEDFDLSNTVHCYENYLEMINNEHLELIAICTESGKHGKIAIDCIESKINLIIEKPIALSLKEADKIVELSKEYNVKVCACHQNRFNKSIQKIREAVESNKFGGLMYGTAHIRWNRNKSYYDQASWRGTWEQDGGALMNQCIHNIDLLRWMLGGEIEEVVGMIDNLNHEYLEAEDLGIALIKFKNGSYGLIEGTTDIYPKNFEETLYLFGKKGTVKAGGKSVNLLEEWIFEDSLGNSDLIKENFSESPQNVYGFGHMPLYEDVIDAIKNDRTPYVSAKDGRDALELVLAIYKSSFEKTIIKLPIEDCDTKQFMKRSK